MLIKKIKIFLIKVILRLIGDVTRQMVNIFWRIEFLRPLLSKFLNIYHRVIFFINYKKMPQKPSTRFNEYLFFLKTSTEIEKPLRKLITDKEFSKIFIEQILGPKRTIETISVFRNMKELISIKFEAFPVVLKPTHSSGRILIIHNNEQIDSSRKTLENWFKHNYFLQSLEKNYERLEKKVIAEKYLEERYNFEGSVHCRDGRAKIISLIDRHTKKRESFCISKKPLGISLGAPLKKLNFKNLDFFPELISDSEKIAAYFSYIRVDFYFDGKNIIFGELTNLPAGGNGEFYPEGGEELFSKYFFS